MNFNLTQIPDRHIKPRKSGITMVMDKGLSVEETKNFLSVAHPHVDIVKLGFGTSYVTPNLEEKLEVYRAYNMPVYFGGTLFEAFLIRNQFEDYISVCKNFGITHMEVSDGSITIPHAEKCGYIEKLTQYGIVLSEVGSKDAAHIIPPYKWIELMKAELEAGSTYVIAEAREAGNVGIYRGSGEVREGLVQEILTQIPGEKILWEAPQKAQQLYFIELLGCNANLGNIAPSEVIPLEAMRIGLRGDTFEMFLTKRKQPDADIWLNRISSFPLFFEAIF
ncbi:MAG: phosphosulfolactate synthase [Chitinophagaceae bacterium]|nr:phosphosulfolactate synthase [Chitinophagaceae bacterium]